jgi:hypothetical protein
MNFLKYVAVAMLTLAPLVGHWFEGMAKDDVRGGDIAKYQRLIEQISKAKTKEEVAAELKGQVDSKKLKKKLGIDGAKDSDQAVECVIEFFATLLMNKEVKSKLDKDIVISTVAGAKGETSVFVQDSNKATICKILVSNNERVYDVEVANLSVLKFFGDNAAASSKKPLVSLSKDERCGVYMKFSKEINEKGSKGLSESFSKDNSKGGAKKSAK